MILDAFHRNNIEIPYPQTDLRLRSGQLEINDRTLAVIEDAGKTKDLKEKKQNDNQTNS